MVSETQLGTGLIGRIPVWLECAADDARLKSSIPGMCVRFEIEVQAQEIRHLDIGPGSDDARQRIRFSAPASVWLRVMMTSPPPGYHAFTALRRMVPEFVVRGSDLVIAQCLAAIERLFELARADQPTTAMEPLPEALSAVRGHYRRLRARHDEAVVFYEEAGQGPPLVLLHTAGADSRQYLDLLANPRMQTQWHMYAFDMPFHGRSLPTESWDGAGYRLQQNEYLEWCLQFIMSIVEAPATVMGCSMGAAIAVALAASNSPWVRGILALEAPDRSPGRLDAHLYHAAVNASLHNPAYVRGLMSPSSPVRRKDLACWYYAQGGPRVYSGDLDFYSREYDGAELARTIDTRQCPVFLLTGEYDYSSSPAATQRLADLIPGAHFEIMTGLGHFPMTEDPIRFQQAVQPILARLRELVTAP